MPTLEPLVIVLFEKTMVADFDAKNLMYALGNAVKRNNPTLTVTITMTNCRKFQMATLTFFKGK